MKVKNQKECQISLPIRSESVSNTQVIDLKWNNVTVTLSQEIKKKTHIGYFEYLLDQDSNKKYILQNVTGYALRGQLTAILGPSGAGKTTLVALLSQRYKRNNNISVSGTFLANNEEYDKFTDFGAFVMQDDLLMATLTVKETLLFSASLRLKGSQMDKIIRVNELIKDLNLHLCQDTYVGDRMLKGISGGEKKRTAIGVELVCDPPVIILDEPTSGLDSYTAFICMNILKKIALKYQRTILFTIHQPSFDISSLFNRVIIMNNGQNVYQGNADQIIGYCEQIGLQVLAYSNPLDTIMNNLNPIYNNQQSLVTYENYSRYLELAVTSFTTQQNGIIKRKTQSTFGQEFKMLFWRAKTHFWRSPVLLRAKLIAAFILSIFIGSLYWNVGDEMPNQSPELSKYSDVTKFLQNMNGACFMGGTGAFFSALHPMMMLFPVERDIFLKEENTKLYKIFPYFITKILVEIPSNISVSIILALILYWAFGFIWEFAKVIQFILITIAVSLSGNGIGIFTGCLFPDPKRAAQLGPVIMLPIQLFGGQLVNLQSIPKWISWFQYVSPFKYFLEAFGRTQLEDVEFKSIIQKGDSFSLVTISPMEYYGRDFGLWNSIIVLFGVAIAFHILAVIMLKLLIKKLNV
ncbi:unnamed protein product [Paramecium pentaurelia]|uniref:ABC transporter domain-containing protein n=1 Tax=Paramecium pentaurelia TaxID=43138 RepID=A0A8S1RZA5_9CILI|nr:unnamed protein product [Paramecium pentaurelia]